MKFILTSILILCLNQKSFSQNGILEWGNNASTNFYHDNFQQSILYYDSIYRTSPQFFNMTFMPEFYSLLKKSSNHDKAIELIHYYAKSDVSTAKVVKPISDYLKIKSITDNVILKEKGLELLKMLTDAKDTTYIASMYYTGLYFHLNEQNILSTEEKMNWINVLTKLNSQASTDIFPEVHDLKQYIDFVLANELFQLGKISAQSVLDKPCSIEAVSRLGFFHLIGNQKGMSSYGAIKKGLIEKGIKNNPSDSLLLKQAVNLVVCYPNKMNMEWLKKHYQNQPEPFETFWLKNIENSFVPFNETAKIAKFCDSLSKSNDWLIIDIWGTWCVPCVEELPNLAKFEKQLNKHPEKHLKLLTLCLGSPKMDEFMKEHKYSFPVLQIEKEDVDKMDVHSYPTTFLISPSGNCLRIPFGMDKIEVVKLLMLY